MQTIRYGLVSKTATYWNFYAGMEKGFFEEEGLDVRTEITGSTSGTIEALIDDRIDIASNCPDHLIKAVQERGQKLMVVGGVIDQAVSTIVTRPEIEDFEDIRGRRVAVTEAEGGVSSLLYAILARKGLKSSEYESVVLGGSPAQAKALEEGRADVAMLTHPFDAYLASRGFRRLGLVSEEIPEYPLTTLNVRERWAKEREDLLVAFLRATIRADDWLFDPVNREPACSILAGTTGLPVETVEQTYKLYIREGALARRASVAVKSIEKVIEIMRECELVEGSLPAPSSFLDLRYLELALSTIDR